MNAPPPDLLERLARALSGQYVVERVLGQGGMGTVFLGRDVTLDRPVAIKVILPDVASSAELRQRFLLEARTVARLRHPNIVSVYSAGESDGLLWFAMEFVPGESLRDRLERERVLPADVVTAIVHDLAMALDDAHVAGIVHRDVKPENILLDQETGRAMLTDFGVARALSSGDSRLTGAGFVLGSPRYMSPEQAAGEEAIDGRSDLYSLGLVAYEMLAGRPTIEAESAGTILIKQITEEPTPLRSLAVDVPDALDTVITRALRKKPEERFTRGRAMAAVLEGRDESDFAATSGSRIAAGTRRAAPTKSAAASRTRILAGVAAVAVVAAGGFALASRAGGAAPANERTWLVAPFELQTDNASLEWLREGAVNMLGLTLSQWNDLSVVDYERTLDLLRSASGDETRRVGLDDARQIARRASAGTVVMGQITTANDSLFVVARRYDVATGNRIDEATAGAPLSADPRAVFERIARELLDLAGGPALSVELARQTTESVQAYRLYLEGLRSLNSWRLAAADTLFGEAIAIDSTFALAYYKRSLGMGWSGRVDSLYERTSARAVEFADRLSPRLREIITGNHDLARGFVAQTKGDLPAARTYWRLAQERLSAIVAIDSTDSEAWYGLADADFHGATATTVTQPDSIALMLTRSLRGFERAIASDSTFHLAYSHLVTLYQMGVNERSQIVIDGDSIILSGAIRDSARLRMLRQRAQERARSFAEGWLAQDPKASQAWQSLIDTYAAQQQFDSAAATIVRASMRPDVYSPAMAFTLPLYRALMTQVPEAQRDLRAALVAFPPESLGVRSATPGALLPIIGMSVAAGTGAAALIDSLAAHASASSESMPVVGLPVEQTARWYAAGVKLAMGVPPSAEMLRTLRNGMILLDNSKAPFLAQVKMQSIGIPYAAYLATGDTSFAVVAMRWGKESNRPLIEFEARLALDRGDTAAARAIARTFRSPDSLGNATLSMAGLRVATQADIRQRLGDLRGAVATYEAMNPRNFQMSFAEPGTAIYARSFLVRGKLYEQLNDPASAIRSYEQFIVWWSGADASLQGELREARAAVQRLRDRTSTRTITPSVPGK